MSAAIVESTGAPYCSLHGHDRRRAYVSADKTDISRTLLEHSPIRTPLSLLDDYDLTDRLGHLETVGAFK